MPRPISFILCATLSLLISGCSSPKDATKENFSKAIQAYLDTKTGFCAGIPADHYPFIMAKDEVFVESNKKRADAFVSAGLLKTRDTELKSRFSTNMVPALEYQLTDLGQKHLVKAGAGPLGNHDAFCTGKYELQDIESFTEPADSVGLKISRVAYAYSLKDAHKWIKHDKVQEAFPDAAQNLAGPIEGRAVLVLTNKGWVHEKQLKQ